MQLIPFSTPGCLRLASPQKHLIHYIAKEPRFSFGSTGSQVLLFSPWLYDLFWPYHEAWAGQILDRPLCPKVTSEGCKPLKLQS